MFLLQEDPKIWLWMATSACFGLSRDLWPLRFSPAPRRTKAEGVLLVCCIRTTKPVPGIYHAATHGECSITGFVFVGGAQLSGGFLALGSGAGSGGEWLSVRWKTSAAVTCLLMALLFMQLCSWSRAAADAEPCWLLSRQLCSGEALPCDLCGTK